MNPEPFEHYIFGRFVKTVEPLSPLELDEITWQAYKAQGKIQDYPLESILNILDEVGKLWRDPEYPGRKIACAHMPAIVGFHEKMVELSIEALGALLDRRALEKKITLEMGNRENLERWRYNPAYGGYIMYQPLGIILHVSAGNVFVSGIDSLVQGMLTKNANLLKLSSADPLFPLLFAKSLKECDPEGILSGSFSILQFRGGDEEIEQKLKRLCNAIVVWGGEEAVMSYRKDLPLGTKLIEYGPKYSFAIATQAGIREYTLPSACRLLAKDIALWEQRACSSPQVIYVEAREDNSFTEEFLKNLSEALDEISSAWPQGELTDDEKVEITRAREMGRVDEVFGEARLLVPRDSTSWTIIFEPSPEFKLSPLNRCIYVKPFRSWADILRNIIGKSEYLQTVGILASPAEVKTLSRALIKCGVTRICEPGQMGEGKVSSPHDGGYQLRQLVKTVCIESVRERFDLGEKLISTEGPPELEEKLGRLLNYASLHSSFYKNRIPETSAPLTERFPTIPLLTRDEVYEHTPPQGEGLLTGPLEGAYVFASGGTMGKPKFSFYTYDEWETVTTIIAGIYEAAGITKSDVVANLFMAGNLWTSFIVANEALAKIGCVTLPIAGNADIELVIKYLQLFRPTALLGLPSILIQLGEYFEKNDLHDIRVSTILYGGEHLSEEGKKYLRAVLGAERILSAGYASVDGGPIGFQCPYSPGTVHHLLTDYQHLEILEPQSGEEVAAGGLGEIVVTNLERHLMPFIRYRTGDLGRRIFRVCQCGKITPLFELLGRCDDVVRVGSVSIYPDAIDKILALFPETSRLYQIVASRQGIKDLLVIKSESRGEMPGDKSALQEKIRTALLEKNPELSEALREGWLGGLSIELVEPGAIPRIRRTGKIKKVVDLRS
ncbi:MAG: acyl-CoA reductase [bacterium]